MILNHLYRFGIVFGTFISYVPPTLYCSMDEFCFSYIGNLCVCVCIGLKTITYKIERQGNSSMKLVWKCMQWMGNFHCYYLVVGFFWECSCANVVLIFTSIDFRLLSISLCCYHSLPVSIYSSSSRYLSLFISMSFSLYRALPFYILLILKFSLETIVTHRIDRSTNMNKKVSNLL